MTVASWGCSVSVSKLSLLVVFAFVLSLAPQSPASAQDDVVDQMFFGDRPEIELNGETYRALSFREIANHISVGTDFDRRSPLVGTKVIFAARPSVFIRGISLTRQKTYTIGHSPSGMTDAFQGFIFLSHDGSSAHEGSAWGGYSEQISNLEESNVIFSAMDEYDCYSENHNFGNCIFVFAGTIAEGPVIEPGVPRLGMEQAFAVEVDELRYVRRGRLLESPDFTTGDLARFLADIAGGSVL